MMMMARRRKTAVCGNGIVEIGEDCDCGLNKSCISVEACCNPRTCQFYSGAECLSGACCSGCKLLPSGSTCRSARTSCDVPETCDGISAQCPDDQYLLDGSTCNENNGICFRGNCAGAQQQCIDMWGSGAKVAHDSCYSNFNPTGSVTGHCGYDSRLNKYIPCFDSDVNCGLLQCEGGMRQPRIATSNFMTFLVNTRDGSFECKSISSPIHSVLVNDGSVCGESSFCQNNTCIQQQQESCDRQVTCSGHGVCTSKGSCYCNPPWKGKDCSIWDTKYQETNERIPLNRTLAFGIDPISPTTLVGISTISFVLLIFCMIFACYFRGKNRRTLSKSHELVVVNNHRDQTPQITVNQSAIEPYTFEPPSQESDRIKVLAQFDHATQSLTSTPALAHRAPLQRSPFMASNRSITSACTGLSFVPTDTPRSVRHINPKPSSSAIFSDSETPRSRVRRTTRYINSPHLSAPARHQQNYATLSFKRHGMNARFQPTKIYGNIDNHSATNTSNASENLRDFIQVLDSLAQEKFGGPDMTYEKELVTASSPTETNTSITLDSGYQSTKQLMGGDDYAVVIKPSRKKSTEISAQRRRSYSLIDNHE